MGQLAIEKHLARSGLRVIHVRCRHMSGNMRRSRSTCIRCFAAAVIFMPICIWCSRSRMRWMRLPLGGGRAEEIATGDGAVLCPHASAASWVTADRTANGKQIIFRALDPMNGTDQELARFNDEHAEESRALWRIDGYNVFLSHFSAVVDCRDICQCRVPTKKDGTLHPFSGKRSRQLAAVVNDRNARGSAVGQSP